MPAKSTAVRVEPGMLDRLEARGRQTGETRSQLARRLLEEGLRTDAHPGVVFRDGPAGRRPALATGPDVWEVARVVRDVEASSEELVERVMELTGLREHQVRAAIGYYRDYRDEVDAWIRRVDELAAEAEVAWRHRRMPRSR
jgi:hypothetical protein